MTWAVFIDATNGYEIRQAETKAKKKGKSLGMLQASSPKKTNQPEMPRDFI